MASSSTHLVCRWGAMCFTASQRHALANRDGGTFMNWWSLEGERVEGRERGRWVWTEREGERKAGRRRNREGERGKEWGREGEEQEKERWKADEDHFLAEKPIQRNLLFHTAVVKHSLVDTLLHKSSFNKPHLTKKLYRAHYSGILLMRNWRVRGILLTGQGFLSSYPA